MKIKINKIYNINCIDGMEEIKKQNIKVDMIITDPPYNQKFNYDKYEDNLEDEEYIKLLSTFKNMPLAIIHYPEETMKYIVPALGVPKEVVAWCYNLNMPRQFRLINFFNCNVDFNKVKQQYKNLNDKRIQERIKNGKLGAKSYDWFSDIQVVKNVSEEKTEHPCPVPIKLMERIILLTTNEGDTVVDPFMGSGTTAIACINTKRNFIGFELSKKYFKISNNRKNDYRRFSKIIDPNNKNRWVERERILGVACGALLPEVIKEAHKKCERGATHDSFRGFWKKYKNGEVCVYEDEIHQNIADDEIEEAMIENPVTGNNHNFGSVADKIKNIQKLKGFPK